MQKANFLFGLVGVVLGVAIGYLATQAINKNPPAPTTPTAANPQAPAGGPPPEVVQLLNKARNEPNNFDLQMQAAELYHQIGRQEQTIEFLKRALQLKPSDETALLNLVNVLLQKGDKTEARKTFQQLEKIKPADDQMKQRRADVRQRLQTP